MTRRQIPSFAKIFPLGWAVAASLAMPAAQAYELKDPQWEQWMIQGRKDELAKAVTQRLAQAPLDGDAWFARSMLVLQKGDQDGWDEFIDAIQGCVGAKPAVPLCHLAIGQVYGAKATQGTFAAMRVGGKLREHLKTASESAPALFDAQQFMLQFYLMAPGVMGGGEEKVEQHLQWVKARQPDMVPLLQAVIRLQKKRLNEAQAELKAFNGKAHPEWAEAHRDLLVQLANRSAGSQQWGLLQFCADQLKGAHPEWAYGPYIQGRLKAEQSKSWDEALQSYEQARSLKGAARIPLDFRVAQALVAKGQKEPAKALLAKVLQSSLASKSVKDEARTLMGTL